MVFLPKHQRDTYSDCDIQQLCEMAEAPLAAQPNLKTALEDVAANYRRMSGGEEFRPTNKETNRELLSIAKRAAQLAQQIEEMSHEASVAFEQQTIEDETQLLLGQPNGPSLILPDEFGKGEASALILERNDTINVLRGIETAATRGSQRQSPRKSGRPFNMALHVWMSNIAAIWGELSTLPFSRSVTDQNDPVSPAARFCALSFKRLSPKTPTSRVMLAMKDNISKRLTKQRKN
ncbi:hypothetical protein D1822_00125 [Phaeobacter inhibens]|uniref:hypothetical protein n=1 Tax=Phaeobacter inhibens TaxID=221822 RepID=UPI0001632EAC|nr:hypothetical protein [Phaeobacter inhibens]AFO89773.1 hypothetical protein PGA1_c00250 [Phaeobacter inhibens DSM 17395]AUQ44400.1 hypothetical protein PhaeoP10_00025 [Phaeobacter inhibens]AXT21331.1 hypothetical protein D1822_00125 [Phaeobacter inhibens]